MSINKIYPLRVHPRPPHVIIHLKLTDSALKMLENLHKKKKNQTIKLMFSDKTGVISIPCDENKLKNFSFSISSYFENSDSSIETLLHNKKNIDFINLGTINQKLVIQASEDAFQNTLDKMSFVESESKKNCVKEIKLKNKQTKILKNKDIKTKHKTILPPVQFQNNFKILNQKINKKISNRGSFERSIKEEMKTVQIELKVKEKSELFSPSTFGESGQPISPIADKGKKLPVFPSSSKNLNSNEKIHNERIDTKKSFNEKYGAYIKLHHRVKNRLSNLYGLVEQFKLEKANTSSYKSLLEMIYNEHKELSTNHEHNKEREECNELHRELVSLKKKINQMTGI